jgi:phenylacetate-coenzyme A ligase PaaK-like adenylate-forming protein
MQNFDQIVTAPGVTKAAVADFLTRSKDPNDLFLGKYRVIHTSGSSGEVGYFVYSTLDWARDDGIAARRRPVRKRKGKLRIAYFAAIDGHYAGVTMVSSFRRGLVKLFVDIGLFEVNSPLPEVIAALNEYQPDFLAGYTTALKILAEKQRAGALKLDTIVGIITAGEATTEATARSSNRPSAAVW